MSDTDRPGPPMPLFSVDDLLTLMAGMAEHRVGLLEMGAMKIGLMPQVKAPTAPQTQAPNPSNEEAKQATLSARERMENARRARIEAAADLAKRRGPGGPPVGGLVKAVYEEAKDEQLTEERQGVSSGSGSG